MSSENSANSRSQSKANPSVSSSIIHKPFATGTINIFNPYRPKSNQSSTPENPPKLFLNAQLEPATESEPESTPQPEPEEFSYQQRNWLDSLINPWSISAIAIILLANLISGAVIWRNQHLAKIKQEEPPLTTLGGADLAAAEFVTLNLSTLSILEPAEVTVTDASPKLEPITPALAPINNALALTAFNSPYHYVLSEYTGERSLALAQQQVQQVSLVNFPQGVFIYLGAFKEREQAEQFVAQLEQENFAAQIYPFE